MSLEARDIPDGEDIGPIERPTSLAVADIVFVVGARQGVRQRASRHPGGTPISVRGAYIIWAIEQKLINTIRMLFPSRPSDYFTSQQ